MSPADQIRGAQAAMLQYFMPDWYLAVYPDVREAGGDPFEHFLNYGILEDRMPNKFFDSAWYRTQYDLKSSEFGITHYLSLSHEQKLQHPVNAVVDFNFINETYDISDGQDILLFLISCNDDIDCVSAWFSRKKYLKANPDVVNSWHAPELHFSFAGVYENRSIDPEIVVTKAVNSGFFSYDGMKFVTQLGAMTHSGQEYVVESRKIPDKYVAEIRKLAEIDPDVVAIGPDSVAVAKQFIATDINTRNTIQYRNILDNMTRRHRALIVLPRLGIGGAEKYAAYLWNSLEGQGVPTQLITTDSYPADDRHALFTHDIFREMRTAPVYSMYEDIRNAWSRELMFALALMRASFDYIFVINSELGLKTVAEFGLPLSSCSKLFVAFFSESPLAVGSPFSARFLRETISYATVISDNKVAINKWINRVSPLYAPRFYCIPQPVNAPRQETLTFTLDERSKRKSKRKRAKVLWFSRWEPFKATDVVISLAEQLSEIDFHVFGPGVTEAEASSAPDNIVFHGAAPSFDVVNLDEFDVFLFTSKFEGMPNVVLEAAARAIPIVASDVGGLRETFSEQDLRFVDMSDPDVVGSFAAAIRNSLDLSEDHLKKQVFQAHHAVTLRHHFDAFRTQIRELLEGSQ